MTKRSKDNTEPNPLPTQQEGTQPLASEQPSHTTACANSERQEALAEASPEFITHEDGRTIIIKDNKDLRKLSREVLETAASLGVLPEIYSRGGSVVTVQRSSDSMSIQVVDVGFVEAWIDSHFAFATMGKGEPKLSTANVSRQVAKKIDGRDFPSFGELDGISKPPVFDLESGTVVCGGEYSRRLRTISSFAPLSEEEYQRLASATRDDARAAFEALTHPMLSGFPFATKADLLNCVALLIGVVAGCHRHANVPAFLITSEGARDGKTLLCQILGVVLDGETPPSTTLSMDAYQQENQLLALLDTSPSVILFDNNELAIKGAGLKSLLTAGEIQGRALGTNKVKKVKNRQVMFFNGISPKVVDDLRRRFVPIQLSMAEKEKWLIKDLLKWVQGNRRALLFHILTMIAAWYKEGKEPGSVSFPSFDSFASLSTGVLAMIGETEALSNLNVIYENSANFTELQDVLLVCRHIAGKGKWTVAELVSIWDREWSHQGLRTSELPSIFRNALGNGNKEKARLGQWLAFEAEQNYGIEHFRIKALGLSSAGSRLYRVLAPGEKPRVIKKKKASHRRRSERDQSPLESIPEITEVSKPRRRRRRPIATDPASGSIENSENPPTEEDKG